MGKQEIFISWSGERSRRIAEHLQIWLKRTIQTLKPFISTKDVEKGAFWFTEIKDKLSETNLGIICLTAENKDKPWVLFEAGALSKGVSISRVCTLLIDVEPKDIVDPLARFNHTTLERDSFFLLLTTINNSLGEDKIDDEVLFDVYNDSWEKFYNKCQEIIKNTDNKNMQKTSRPNDEIIADVLEINREMDKKINALICENYEKKFFFRKKTCRFIVESRKDTRLHIRRLLADLRTAENDYSITPIEYNGNLYEEKYRYSIKITNRVINGNSPSDFEKRMRELKNRILSISGVLAVFYEME